MRRALRSKAAETVKNAVTSSPTEPSTSVEDKKFDLSKYALKPKRKLTPTKREHVKVEYDDSPPKKPTPEVSDVEVLSKVTKMLPENWQEVLDNLRKMRSGEDAPVDSMGCQRCSDGAATPEDGRYLSLLSLMLSSQTKDQVTHAAMGRLKDHGCTVQDVSNTPEAKIGELIYPVSFWRTKAKHIKLATEILKEQYKGDIPNSIEGLCKLPGVGPKMAHLCMQIAWNEVTGIGVDTHVHRISNRLGWVNTKNPEGTRKGLEAKLPFELWPVVNQLMVGFGQQICKPVKPLCATCLNNKLCPFGIKELKEKKSGKKK